MKSVAIELFGKLLSSTEYSVIDFSTLTFRNQDIQTHHSPEPLCLPHARRINFESHSKVVEVSGSGTVWHGGNVAVWQCGWCCRCNCELKAFRTMPASQHHMTVSFDILVSFVQFSLNFDRSGWFVLNCCSPSVWTI